MAKRFVGFESKTPLGDSALILAARTGDLATLKCLFASLLDLFGNAKSVELLSHHCNKLGKTVLHESAQHSHVECVRFLVEHVGMAADSLKQGDWTPLMLACTKNNLHVIEILVDHLADVWLTNKDGWTPFHIACREGNGPIVSFFLTRFPNIWRTTSNNGRTPLHTAAMYGRIEVTQILLDMAKYLTDEKDACGSSPLMDSLRSGHVDIARLLTNVSQASCTVDDSLGRQPLHLSAQTGQFDSIVWLIDEMKIDPNSRTSGTLLTAAHFAAKENHIRILDLLIKRGADLNVKDAQARTPLHLAAAGQHADSVKFLLKHATIEDNLDAFGKYAVNYAVKAHVIKAFVV